MTPLSNRFALACSILFAVTLAISTLAIQSTPDIEDCANPEALSAPDLFDGTEPFRSDPEMLRKDLSLWSHSKIKMKHGLVPPFSVAIARTHKPIRFYLQPDAIAPMLFPPDRKALEWVEHEGGELPVHIFYTVSRSTATAGTAFTAYVFLYQNETVARPFLSQIRSAGQDLFIGRRPLTMLMVRGTVARIYLEQATDFAKEWLVNAAVRYQAVCAE